ncbi:alkaline phosphatase family protein [Oerskovia flava]|uniref:alkaline phosphatase family protein n=1 Tax=Oerskovia flava TaxID=2986422 RepID=UPI00223EAC80|nr:alkaline phosphatase family protein [Oerskovia sp. JB1-3-2]
MRPRFTVGITLGDVTGALWSLVSTTLGLGLAIWLVPGVEVTNLAVLPLAALAVAVGDVLLRPLLRQVAVRSGAVGALVSGVAAQLGVVWLALAFLPGFTIGAWTDVVLVLVVAAVLMALGRWSVGARDNEYVVGDLLRRARRAAARDARRGNASQRPAARPGDPPTPDGLVHGRGMLVVQLDGVSRTTFDHALQAGLVPTLARWTSSGRHRVETWWACVPSTTPASQAGLLHGSSAHVPAFRWWDRGVGRMVVTNRPADAADVEARTSDGDGLLAQGGVAVSTMFSGDAPTALLVMSRARSGMGPGQMFVRFFSSPFVLSRALVATVAEFFKELYQGWQQAARGVEPRVGRLGAYPALRALSNVVLRDLNTSLVAEQLVRGAPVIFVDLVDYDEIAHHAGPLRPESLRSLEGLDQVLGLWEQVAEAAARDYEIVVLSDHGQSLGATFQQVVGRPFAAEVRRLMALPVDEERSRAEADVEAATEQWGAVNTALNALARSGEGRVLVGPDRVGTARRPGDAPGPAARAHGTADGPEGGQGDLPEVAVVGSGNLGLVWFPREPAPVLGDTVRARWPALLPGLLACPAVGVVVTREAPSSGEPGAGPGDPVPDVVAHGPRGRHNLVTGRVEGEDPLVGMGPRAADDLLRAAHLEQAGDLLLVSRVGDTGMVHAFEGLVGSHGGLGGAQNEAILVHPARLEVPDGERDDVGARRMLVGAEAVHTRLVAWLEEIGART